MEIIDSLIIICRHCKLANFSLLCEFVSYLELRFNCLNQMIA